jgi:hydrogenase maturation factor HypF (carbamoyltransferase family)
MTCILVGAAAFSEKLGAQNGQNNIAVSGNVTGDVQQVGFRAMIQKLAIEYNLSRVDREQKRQVCAIYASRRW